MFLPGSSPSLTRTFPPHESSNPVLHSPRSRSSTIPLYERFEVVSRARTAGMREESTSGGYQMDAWLWILIVVAAVVVLAAVVTMFLLRRRRRHALRDRFGPEYDRRVDGAKSRRKAEGDLAGRAKRRDDLELRPLSQAARIGTPSSGSTFRADSSTSRRPRSSRPTNSSSRSCAIGATRSTISNRSLPWSRSIIRASCRSTASDTTSVKRARRAGRRPRTYGRALWRIERCSTSRQRRRSLLERGLRDGRRTRTRSGSSHVQIDPVLLRRDLAHAYSGDHFIATGAG